MQVLLRGLEKVCMCIFLGRNTSHFPEKICTHELYHTYGLGK